MWRGIPIHEAECTITLIGALGTHKEIRGVNGLGVPSGIDKENCEKLPNAGGPEETKLDCADRGLETKMDGGKGLMSRECTIGGPI